MDVQGVLELFWQGFYLKPLLTELLLEIVNFFSQISNLRSLRFQNSKFLLLITNLEFKKTNISNVLYTRPHLLLEYFEEFYFLKQQSQPIISSDKLCTKNISLIDTVFVVFLNFIKLFSHLLNHITKFIDFLIYY